MTIKLKFEDFQVEDIHQAEVKGGAENVTTSTCTAGDVGCCDNSHNDDFFGSNSGHGSIPDQH